MEESFEQRPEQRRAQQHQTIGIGDIEPEEHAMLRHQHREGAADGAQMRAGAHEVKRVTHK